MFIAQLTTTVTPPTVPHGQPAAITISLAHGDIPVAGLQFSVTLPPGWVIGTPTLTPQTMSVPKFLASEQTNGSLFCLIYGLSLDPVPDGVFITIPVTSPIKLPPGPVDVVLSGLVASSPAGVSIPISGTGAMVTLERHHWWRRRKRKGK